MWRSEGEREATCEEEEEWLGQQEEDEVECDDEGESLAFGLGEAGGVGGSEALVGNLSIPLLGSGAGGKGKKAVEEIWKGAVGGR